MPGANISSRHLRRVTWRCTAWPATRGMGFTWNRQKPGVSAADSTFTRRRVDWEPAGCFTWNGMVPSIGAASRYARSSFTWNGPKRGVGLPARPSPATNGPRACRCFTWNVMSAPMGPLPATLGGVSRGMASSPPHRSHGPPPPSRFTWNRQKPGVSAADSTSRRGEWVGSLPVFHVERHGGAGHRGATARHAKSRFKGYGPRPGATAADSNEVVRRTACGI